MKIGFIGVGLMGHGMAKNLMEKGHTLTILGNRNRAPVDDLVSRGAVEAKQPKDVAAASDMVFLCVPSSAHVEQIVLGDGGIIDGAKKGMILVDTSTADPNSTLKVAETLAAKGVRMVDAPLARTPKEAEEGRLNVMIGADDALFAEIEPVIACFAENIFHVGTLGAGHKIKLINNFVSLAIALVTAEAATAANKVGVDVGKLRELISAGGSNCGMFQAVMSYILEDDSSRMQFAITNAAKDLRYFAQMANGAKMAGAVSGNVLSTFAMAEAMGHGDDFVPHVFDLLATVNGVDGVE